MEILGILFIIACFALNVSSAKKKKAEAEARRAKQAGGAAAEPVRPARPAEAKEKIPFTKEEWLEYMKKQAGISTEKPAAAKPAARPAAAPKKPAAPKRARAAAAQSIQPGGSLGGKSTQGETEAEHQAHLKKMADEDAEILRNLDTARELRELNRQKLRTAVVMSEVLAPPVTLRPRGMRGRL